MNSPLAAMEAKNRSEMVALLRDPNLRLYGGSDFALEIARTLAAIPMWEPMESAPKGTRLPLIGWVNGVARLIRWTKTSHVPLYGWCLVDQGSEDCDLCKPVAWQWMPATPPDVAAENSATIGSAV